MIAHAHIPPPPIIVAVARETFYTGNYTVHVHPDRPAPTCVVKVRVRQTGAWSWLRVAS